ncbi:MAG: RNA polymerase sigma factor [Polyangiaceae bacterium]
MNPSATLNSWQTVLPALWQGPVRAEPARPFSWERYAEACAERRQDLPSTRNIPKSDEPCTVRAVEWDAEALEAERELCARAHAGDRAAMGELLKTYGPKLFRSLLLPKLGNHALAEEALSATYIKVVERFDRFTWQDVGVYPWLRVVAMRVALDMLRKKKRERLFEPQDLEREIEASEANPHKTPDALERHDLAVAQDRVKRAMSRINPRYAQVIQLRILEEKSREEAAAELGVSVGTLDVVLHRAMAALKKATLADGADS